MEGVGGAWSCAPAIEGVMCGGCVCVCVFACADVTRLVPDDICALHFIT